MRKYIVLILSIVLMMMLAACGNDDAKDDKGKEEEATKVEVSADEKVAEDKVVAHINDVEVTGKVYNLIYVQTKVQLHQFGQDIEDLDMLKETALDVLVGQELVMQDAKEHGITITEEEIDKEFDDFKSEKEEQLAALLEQYDLTEDAFKDQLKFSLIHEKYLSIPDMDVSDKEAEDKYEELKKENKEIPEFDTIKDQIKVGIKQDKLQEKVNELKEKANIEMLI